MRISSTAWRTSCVAASSATPSCRPNEIVTAGKLALVIDHQRRDPALEARHVGQRNLRAAAAADEDVRQVVRVALVLRIDLEDDAILVALGIDRRHLPLRVRIGERGVDVLDAHAEPRGRLPVDRDVELEAALLAIGRHVDHARHGLHAVDRARHPFQQFVEIGAPQRELVLRAAPAAADAHVLRREHPHVDPRNARELRPQPVDHTRGRDVVALGQRLQADEHAALVDRRAPRRAADRGADAGDRRIGQDDVERLAAACRPSPR